MKYLILYYIAIALILIGCTEKPNEKSIIVDIDYRKPIPSKTFFESVGLIPTGLSGFSLIISNAFEKGGINVPTAVIYLVINLFIFLFALKIFGWKFSLGEPDSSLLS